MLPTPWLTTLHITLQWGASCSLLFRISCSGGAILMTLLASWTRDPGTSPVCRALSGGSPYEQLIVPALSLAPQRTEGCGRLPHRLGAGCWLWSAHHSHAHRCGTHPTFPLSESRAIMIAGWISMPGSTVRPSFLANRSTWARCLCRWLAARSSTCRWWPTSTCATRAKKRPTSPCEPMSAPNSHVHSTR